MEVSERVKREEKSRGWLGIDMEKGDKSGYRLRRASEGM